MNNPAHSFAVLAFGESPYLEECLRSLEQQTHHSAIYIATSTPSQFLEDAARRHRVQLLVNPDRTGIAADWTFAFRQCTTRYLTLAHQDDRYLPEYTGSCLVKSRGNPGNLVVFTDYYEQSGQRLLPRNRNMVLKKMILLLVFGGREALPDRLRKRLAISFGQPIPCPSVMYHIARIGPFSFSPDYAINLDWDAWLRLSQRTGSFVYHNRRLMVHRLHPGSQTAAGLSSQKRQEEDRRMFLRLWPAPVGKTLAALYSLAYLRGSHVGAS